MTRSTYSPSLGKLWGLRRMADKQGRFKMLAVDQRPPIKNPIARARGVSEAPYGDVTRFKLLLIEALQDHATAVLLDPHYALPQGIRQLNPTKGLIVTLEDSIFLEEDGGRRSVEIDHWSVAKIKRCGGDAVKVLAWYRPDADPTICQAQQDFVKRIGAACAQYDIPFLFELLVYPLAKDAHQTKDYVEMMGKNADHVLASVAEFAKPDYGVDVFKLESPATAAQLHAQGHAHIQSLFDEMGRLADRPWVMLSAGADQASFKTILEFAYQAGASGYLAGRAIWLDAFQAFPDWARIHAKLTTDAARYMADINTLTDEKARSWYDHISDQNQVGLDINIKDEDANLRLDYPDFSGQ